MLARRDLLQSPASAKDQETTERITILNVLMTRSTNAPRLRIAIARTSSSCIRRTLLVKKDLTWINLPRLLMDLSTKVAGLTQLMIEQFLMKSKESGQIRRCVKPLPLQEASTPSHYKLVYVSWDRILTSKSMVHLGNALMDKGLISPIMFIKLFQLNREKKI